MADKPRYWMSPPPTLCDLTQKPIGNSFVDGRIEGRWGCMDPSAYRKAGGLLGSGNGQRYERQADGRWLKVEG